MFFDRNENKEVIALLGAGSMGTAIIRRFAAGRKILLGDISEKNLEKTAHEFTYSGYDVETCIVDMLMSALSGVGSGRAESCGKVFFFPPSSGRVNMRTKTQ